MGQTSRPFRSVLYIPASKERALEKAKSLPVDAIIFDLEDAVAPAEKEAARDLLVQTLKAQDFGPRYRIVRINGAGTPWHDADLDAFAKSGADAILLPKVGSAEDVEKASESVTAPTKIWAMMETPQGIMNAAGIAAAPGIEGFVMGTNDLAKDLGARTRSAMMVSLQMCLLAARANDLVCVDGVFNAFKDEDGLSEECLDGRNLGMDGKTLIHPAQIAIANSVFAPSADEADLARRQIAAYDDAISQGEAVAVVDGKIVENLHVETAKRLLAQVEAIAKIEETA